MAKSVVTVLLNQLDVMLHDEKKLLRGLKREVQTIKDELMSLMQVLKVKDGIEDENNHLKDWTNQLEISPLTFKMFLTNTRSGVNNIIAQVDLVENLEKFSIQLLR